VKGEPDALPVDWLIMRSVTLQCGVFITLREELGWKEFRGVALYFFRPSARSTNPFA